MLRNTFYYNLKPFVPRRWRTSDPPPDCGPTAKPISGYLANHARIGATAGRMARMA